MGSHQTCKNYFIEQHTIFWVMTPCSSEISPRFAETHRLRFRGGSTKPVNRRHGELGLLYVRDTFPLELLGFLRTAWNHIPEERNASQFTAMRNSVQHISQHFPLSRNSSIPQTHTEAGNLSQLQCDTLPPLTFHDLSNLPVPISRRLYIKFPVTARILSL
jgi:hypothetical protein